MEAGNSIVRQSSHVMVARILRSAVFHSLFTLTMVAVPFLWQHNAVAAGSLYHARCSVNGIPIQVITVNLRDPSLLVTPAIALGSWKQQKTFAQFQTQYQALAQITGTFFDLDSGYPIGDVVIRGEQVCTTNGIGSALVITPKNEAAILDAKPDKTGWKGYESVLQGGLRLVRHGSYAFDPAGQGFHDRYMQRCTTRIVVGLRADQTLLMVKTGNVLLEQLAYAMIALRCEDAMALDGGTSSAMGYQGKCTFLTLRRLSNVLMVVRRS